MLLYGLIYQFFGDFCINLQNVFLTSDQDS